MQDSAKMRNILFFFFLIIFSNLSFTEINFTSAQAFQDNKTVKVIILVDSSEDLNESNINIYEYQSASSLEDLLLNFDFKRTDDSSYVLSFEKIDDNYDSQISFTVQIKDSTEDFFISLSDQSYDASLEPKITDELISKLKINDDNVSENIIIQANDITTVWSMAKSLNYDDLSIYQVMWSIFENNRSAFIDDNINLIRNDIDITVPEIKLIKEIDKAYAKSNVREMIDAYTYETNQMLTLLAPDKEKLIVEEILEVKQEDVKSFEIQSQSEANLDSEAISEFPTRKIVIESTGETDIPFEEIKSGTNILQLLAVSLISLIVGFLVAILLIKRSSSPLKDVSENDDDVSSIPKGLSIKNDPFIQQFDLAISLYKMKDYEKAKPLLDEIINKAKNQKLIQQANDLRSKL